METGAPHHLLKKLAALFISCVISLILLELGLRSIGALLQHLQERRNQTALRAKRDIRILCLGESTTADFQPFFPSYPRQLERLLNSSSLGLRFSVINKGRVATRTSFIAENLPEYLRQYKPHIIIAMMGINDGGPAKGHRLTPLVADEKRHSLLQKTRVGKLLRYLVSVVFRKPPEDSTPEAQGPSGQEREKRTPSRDRTEGKEAFERGVRRFKEKGIGAHITDYITRHRFAARTGLKELVGEAKEASVLEGDRFLSLCLLAELLKNELDEGSFAEFSRCLVNSFFDPILAKHGVHPNPALATSTKRAVEKYIELFPQSSHAFAVGAIFCDGLKTGFREGPSMRDCAKYYEEAIRLNPAFSELGMDLLEANRLSLAKKVFLTVLKKEPSNDSAYLGLAQCYRQANDLDRGIKLLRDEALPRTASHTGTTAAKIRQQLADLLVLRGRPGEAKEVLEAEILRQKQLANATAKPDPSSVVSAYGYLSAFYWERGNPERAEAVQRDLNAFHRSHIHEETFLGFHIVRKLVADYGGRLVLMQYPLRSVETIKAIFADPTGIIFVDNEGIFRDALRRRPRRHLFIDSFAGDFGHCTEQGNRLIAENVARILMREYLNVKRP